MAVTVWVSVVAKLYFKDYIKVEVDPDSSVNKVLEKLIEVHSDMGLPNIEDLKTANMAFVNSKSVAYSQLVTEGDKITLLPYTYGG